MSLKLQRSNNLKLGGAGNGIQLKRDSMGLNRGATEPEPEQIETVGDLESADEAYRRDLHEQFNKSAEQEALNFSAQVDTAFWIALSFQSREALDEFLRKAGWEQLALNRERYLCGEEVADHMGIVLETPVPRTPAYRVNKRLAALSSLMDDAE